MWSDSTHCTNGEACTALPGNAATNNHPISADCGHMFSVPLHASGDCLLCSPLAIAHFLQCFLMLSTTLLNPESVAPKRSKTHPRAAERPHFLTRPRSRGRAPVVQAPAQHRNSQYRRLSTYFRVQSYRTLILFVPTPTSVLFFNLFWIRLDSVLNCGCRQKGGLANIMGQTAKLVGAGGPSPARLPPFYRFPRTIPGRTVP